MQSGVIRVLVALNRVVRMIRYLWARDSKLQDDPRCGYWGLGELGILLFCSPQDFVVLGVFCARFPPREASTSTLHTTS